MNQSFPCLKGDEYTMTGKRETNTKKSPLRWVIPVLLLLVAIALVGTFVVLPALLQEEVTTQTTPAEEAELEEEEAEVLNPFVEELTLEAGSDLPDAKAFLLDSAYTGTVTLQTDPEEIDTAHVGTYAVTLLAEEVSWAVTLTVVDTIAPQGTPQEVLYFCGGTLAAESLLEEITDATDVTCTYLEEPDLTQEGTIYPVVVLTDEGGNTTQVTCTLTLVLDETAPVIDGVAPLTAYIDVPISYKTNVTVTDDYDQDVKVTVNTDEVNDQEEGTYTITYSATDWAGNTTEVSTTVTFKEKPEDYVEESVVLEEAAEILAEITTEDMTKKQIAYAIYKWCRSHISYTNTSDHSSWTTAAHQGFTKRSGDCWVYFSTAKAMLTQAGIPNIDVEIMKVRKSMHYWSLIDVGDGWYHFDTTPRSSGGDFFLLTDEEILAYSAAHYKSHAFDTSLYPATPTVPSTIE